MQNNQNESQTSIARLSIMRIDTVGIVSGFYFCQMDIKKDS